MDASYNRCGGGSLGGFAGITHDVCVDRFAWNDPRDLPSWFQDDETRHNKPQLPIPQALLDQA